MSKNYQLTIIMSNYNQAVYIEKAIQSVLAQKLNFDYKLLITDDCSTEDNSVDIIKKYVENYENIEAIFADNNGGYLTNILRAKENTKTEYFCLLDADDYWTDTEWLQRAFDFLESHGDYAIYEANVLTLQDKTTKPFLPPKIVSGTYTIEDFVDNKLFPITQTTGMFFRNTIFKNGIPKIMKTAIGTLSERSFEGDVNRFIMHLKTGKVFYDKRPVGIYRITSNGIWVRLKNSEKNLLNARAYMDYYRYYQEYIEFFSNRSWFFFQKYLDAKQKETMQFTHNEEYISTNELSNANAVYQFCHENAGTLRKNNEIYHKLKKIYHIIKS